METQGLVHHGSNGGKVPVVIELASLLQAGAPLSTPVGQSATGTPLHVTADLDSQSRTLHTVGADGSVTYGWNQLVGTATVDGQPVGVELLGQRELREGERADLRVRHVHLRRRLHPRGAVPGRGDRDRER